MYYIHYIILGTKGVTFYDVLGKLRHIVCIFIVPVMFSESHVERLTSLSNIFFVAYTTNSNLGKLLEMQKSQKPNKFDKNGVYQLTCPTCHKKYVGQTGRPFHVQTSENTRSLFYPLNFIYLSATYNILVLIVNIVGIPTCSQHLLT